MELTDAQWAIIEPLIPKPRGRKDRRGRPWREPREVLGFVHLGCICILPRYF